MTVVTLLGLLKLNLQVCLTQTRTRTRPRTRTRTRTPKVCTHHGPTPRAVLCVSPAVSASSRFAVGAAPCALECGGAAGGAVCALLRWVWWCMSSREGIESSLTLAPPRIIVDPCPSSNHGRPVPPRAQASRSRFTRFGDPRARSSSEPCLLWFRQFAPRARRTRSFHTAAFGLHSLA